MASIWSQYSIFPTIATQHYANFWWSIVVSFIAWLDAPCQGESIAGVFGKNDRRLGDSSRFVKFRRRLAFRPDQKKIILAHWLDHIHPPIQPLKKFDEQDCILPAQILGQEARQEIEKAGLGHLVKVFQEDATKASVKEATVITLYLSDSGNTHVINSLKKQIQQQTRVVSFAFPIQGYLPDKTDKVHGIGIYLYNNIGLLLPVISSLTPVP